MSDEVNKGRSGERSGQWINQMVVLRRTKTWQPATDAYETPDQFIVVVELAGMRAGDFTVNLLDRRLVISGRRSRLADEDLIAYHQLEVPYGTFRTEVALPWSVDRAQVTATYEDGFLRITLPRRKQSHHIRVVDVQDDENEDGQTP